MPTMCVVPISKRRHIAHICTWMDGQRAQVKSHQRPMQNWRRLQQFAVFFMAVDSMCVCFFVSFVADLCFSFRSFCHLPNIFLAHKSVDYDYLANFLVMNCPDDPDDTFQTDAVDFARPKLLAEHFLNRLELHWTVRLVIQHKPLLNLPNVLVGHPALKTEEEREKNTSKKLVKTVYIFGIFILMSLKSFAVFLTMITWKW